MSIHFEYTRYISSFINELISDVVRFSVARKGLSVEEITIISLVCSESGRVGRKDAVLIRAHGTEDAPFPEELLVPVSVKFVHTSLGMSRETARRRLEDLSKRGFLKRMKGGYIFPVQVGNDDYTSDVRQFLVGKLEELSEYVRKIPD